MASCLPAPCRASLWHLRGVYGLLYVPAATVSTVRMIATLAAHEVAWQHWQLDPFWEDHLVFAIDKALLLQLYLWRKHMQKANDGWDDRPVYYQALAPILQALARAGRWWEWSSHFKIAANTAVRLSLAYRELHTTARTLVEIG